MTMIAVKRFILFSTLFFLMLTQSFALQNKILFKVNNEIITSLDIFNEIEYMKLLNKNLANLEKNKIFAIAKNSLIREKIKTIELLKFLENLEVEEKYLNLLLDEFTKRLDLKSRNELKSFVTSKGIKMETVEKKIKKEILWNQLIVSKFSKDLKINKDKIRTDILKNNLQKEYLLSEIIFDLNNGEKLEEKFDIIKKEISKNGFENAALIHSISNTSNNGGKLGWIKANSLNKKIKSEITNIANTSYTNPIVIPGGFLILKIEEERETNIVDNIEKEIELISNEIANKQLNQFANIYFNKIKKEVEINEF